MANILGIIYGIVFGVANIIPGVSGGTMLVAFGCYDKVCGALSLDFKEIKKNWKFLVFFAVGAAVGLVGFSNVITLLFDNFPTETYMFFIGLIIGSIPLIVRSATVKEKFRPTCIIPFLTALAAVVALTILENMTGDASAEREFTVSAGSLLKIAGASCLAAVAMIIPGVSGSFIMVLLGTYSTVVGAVSDMDFTILIPAAIGILIGLIFGAKLIKLLLKKWRLMVFSAILGMCAGSLYAILPEGLGLDLHTLIGVFALIAGGALSFLVGKHTKVEKDDN